MTSAVVAGVMATAVTHPFDVLRVRIQLFPNKYRNMWVASKSILKEEGPSVLLRGISPRLIRKTLSAAITWTLYEELIKIL